MSDKIKLVIWDLDETLWNGTLSDGAVSENPDMSHLLRHLASRGVISAVCSKNDEAAAAQQLTSFGLLDYIVMLSVSWESKGRRIKDMISTLQLRPCNVLFVDDNMSNLQEAKFLVPDIQIAAADQLLGQIAEGQLVFDEKDDSGLERLNQYKLLMKRKDSEKACSSNEEFLYYSDIRVELLEDNAERLGRIHEMIHRNNQLNFTKDRISPEEVRALFLDPSVRSGCVSVRDRFGDHGIIGCYAVKDGRLAQFVFSCRILNMGVEQWVYAALGFPEITVVGPVASQLQKDTVPGWINRSDTASPEITEQKKERIAVYGSCPLRPVWAYLQPVFPDSYFAEIDPEPSICNLAVTARESSDYLAFVLEHVRTFHKQYTFDTNIFSGNVDYVLISLDEALSFCKYQCGEHVFFSKKLTPESSDDAILGVYSEAPVTCEDIEAALSALCDSLGDTVLLIMNNPETVFPIKGKNSDYQKRVRLNQIADRLCGQKQNVRLIDLRKYAKSPTDFYDTYAGHFNRSVAYHAAQDIMQLIDPDHAQDTSPAPYDGRKKVTTARLMLAQPTDVTLTVGIENGLLTCTVEAGAAGALDACTFDYEIFCGSVREQLVADTSETAVRISCQQPGEYRAAVTIRCAGRPEQTLCSDTLLYSAYNFFLFENGGGAEDQVHLEGLKQFCEDNAAYAKLTREYIRDIAMLPAANLQLADYFTDRGIQEISVFTDDTIGSIVIPLLRSSGLRIRHIYSLDKKEYFDCGCALDILLTEDINTAEIRRGEHVFFAYSGRKFEKWTSLFALMGARIHNLSFVLSALKTRGFLEKIRNDPVLPRIIAVRCPHIHPFFAFPYTSVLASEKASAPLKARIPETVLDRERLVHRFRDERNADFTIRGGRRLTAGQPEGDAPELYVYGDSYVFGYGVRDSETIPSRLQQLCGDRFRVHNMSNIWYLTDSDHMIRSMMQHSYRKEDVLVLCLTSWRQESAEKRWHWLNWEECVRTGLIETADAFPLFMQPDREPYFLAKGAYTPAGNQAIAELIRDYLNRGEAE